MLLFDLKEDVREERTTLGDFTKAALYDVRELSVFLTPVGRSPFILFIRSCIKSQRVS